MRVIIMCSTYWPALAAGSPGSRYSICCTGRWDGFRNWWESGYVRSAAPVPHDVDARIDLLVETGASVLAYHQRNGQTAKTADHQVSDQLDVAFIYFFEFFVSDALGKDILNESDVGRIKSAFQVSDDGLQVLDLCFERLAKIAQLAQLFEPAAAIDGQLFLRGGRIADRLMDLVQQFVHLGKNDGFKNILFAGIVIVEGTLRFSEAARDVSHSRFLEPRLLKK